MRLVIYGTGGHGREIAEIAYDCIQAGARFKLEGFLDDSRDKHGTSVAGLPVLGGDAYLETSGEIAAVVAVGNPVARKQVVERIQGPSVSFATLVHPSAYLGRDVHVDVGTVVFPRVSMTTNVRIGKHVSVNQCASVSHDCVVEDYVALGPQVALAGAARVAEGSDLGVQVGVKPCVSIGPWAVVGAGAAVVSDLQGGQVYAGIPAKPLR